MRQVRHGAGTEPDICRQDDLHLPDAPGNPPRRARRLPEVRDGVRARHGVLGRGGKPRTGGHDPPPPHRRGAGPAGFPAGDVPPDSLARPRSAAQRRCLALDPVHPLDARGDVGGMAVFQTRLAFACEPEFQHVHAHRHRRQHRLRLQRGSDLGTRPVSRITRHPRPGRHLLRGRRSDRHARPARPGPRTPRPWQNRQRHPRAARSRAQDRAPRRGRQRTRRAARIHTNRRDPTRPPRRESPGRWQHPRRPILARRIHDHRRADAREQDHRRSGDRRHAQHHRQLHHDRHPRRQRHRARPHRENGRRGPAQPRAHPGAGGPGRRLFRPGGARHLAGHVSVMVVVRPRAAPRLRHRQRGRRPDHRLPLRPRPRHADVRHGRHRPRRAGRHPHPQRRSHRVDGKSHHRRRG